MEINKLAQINIITNQIIALKQQSSTMQTKKTIQKLQQQLDDIIKGKNEL